MMKESFQPLLLVALLIVSCQSRRGSHCGTYVDAYPTTQSIRNGEQIYVLSGAHPEFTTNSLHTVDDYGRIRLPYLGDVTLAGLTPSAAAMVIESRYQERSIFRKPSIVVVRKME